MESFDKKMKKTNQLLIAGWICIAFEIVSFTVSNFNSKDSILGIMEFSFFILAMAFFFSALIINLLEFARRIREIKLEIKNAKARYENSLKEIEKYEKSREK